MSIFGDFKTSEIKDDEYELIPDLEDVLAIVSKAEELTGKDSGVPYLCLYVKIVEGQYNNRMILDNLYLNSQTEGGRNIAKRKLAKLTRAINVEIPDMSNILNKPFRIKTGIEPGNNGYKDKNVIRDYLPVNKPAQAPQAQATSQAPWKQSQKVDEEIF